jgi:hypothetical protein
MKTFRHDALLQPKRAQALPKQNAEAKRNSQGWNHHPALGQGTGSRDWEMRTEQE